MICPNCGKELAADSLFCNYCGNRIIKEDAIQENEKEKTMPEGAEKAQELAKRNTVIKILLIVLFVGLIGFLTVSWQKNIANETLMTEFEDYFQKGEYKKAYDLYHSEMQENKMLVEKTGEYLLDQINSIEKLYGEKILTYEAAMKQLAQIAEYDLLPDQVLESREKLIALKQVEMNSAEKRANSETEQLTDTIRGEMGKPVLEVISTKTRSSLVFNECYVQVKNLSERSIEKYELLMLYFDKDGKVANDATTGANIGKGQSDENLHPGQTSAAKLHYCIPGNAEKVKAIVSRVEFFDGGVWYLDDLNEWIASEKDSY